MLTGTKTQTVCQFFTYFPLTNTTHTEIIKKQNKQTCSKLKKKKGGKNILQIYNNSG